MCGSSNHVLTFQSVEKKRLVGLSHGDISFLTFFKMKFRYFVALLTLATSGSEIVK